MRADARFEGEIELRLRYCTVNGSDETASFRRLNCRCSSSPTCYQTEPDNGERWFVCPGCDGLVRRIVDVPAVLPAVLQQHTAYEDGMGQSNDEGPAKPTGDRQPTDIVAETLHQGRSRQAGLDSSHHEEPARGDVHGIPGNEPSVPGPPEPISDTKAKDIPIDGGNGPAKHDDSDPDFEPDMGEEDSESLGSAVSRIE